LASGAVAADPDGVLVASNGPPPPETRVKIVDDEGRELGGDAVGHILVTGPSIMKGYHALPEATASVLEAGWLRTGDKGYLRAGELRITGRSKDLIIIRGRNYAPSDFEWAAEEVAG